MEKQQVSEKKIVASFVFSVFVVASAIGFIANMLLGYFVGGDSGAFPVIIVSGIMNLVGIWIGVIYAAKSVNKRYVVENADSIALSSYIYLTLVWLVFFLPIGLFGASIMGVGGLTDQPALTVVVNNFFSVLSTLVLLAASRKYLKVKS